MYNKINNMTKEQALLQQACNEIKILRNANQLMKARLDMFDDCIALLSARVERSGGLMSPDLVWEIEKHLSNKSEMEAGK